MASSPSSRTQSTWLTKAKAFEAPSSDDFPEDLFLHDKNDIELEHSTERFIRFSDDDEYDGQSGREYHSQILIYAEGALSHKTETSTGGCAFVFVPSPWGRSITDRSRSFRLEQHGPDGRPYAQTNYRAEIRAALGALEFRDWWTEPWKSIVIATHSQQLVQGITVHVERSARQNWVTDEDVPIANRDLWIALLARINELAQHGVEVSFWWIGWVLDREANQLAKDVAEHGDDVEHYEKVPRPGKTGQPNGVIRVYNGIPY